MALNKEKEMYAKKFLDEHNKAQDELRTKKNAISNKEYSLRVEIEKLEAITDVCPTCGQKIPGAVKPDTTTKRAELDSLVAEVNKYTERLKEDNNSYDKIVEELDSRYDSKIIDLQAKRQNLITEAIIFQGKDEVYDSTIKDLELQIATVTKTKEFYTQDKERVIKQIADLNTKIKELADKASELSKDQADIINHIEVVKKMTTIITRDFRGFLLKNIIEYINIKAKEYTAKIFGCDEIEFILDGNNIDISFCNKDYENLSGGEKQRVDLIVQFAIRDSILTVFK